MASLRLWHAVGMLRYASLARHRRVCPLATPWPLTNLRETVPVLHRPLMVSVHCASDTSASAAATAWTQHWELLLQRLHAAGHFASDSQVTEADVTTDKGAMKRAVLSFARQRADILAVLDGDKLKRLVRAGAPGAEADRKTRNAYRRLEASIVKEQPLGPGDGGPADLQDVLRLVLALDASSAPSAPYAPDRELAAAAGGVLPDVIKAMEAPAPGGVALSEKAKNMARRLSGEGKRRADPMGKGMRTG